MKPKTTLTGSRLSSILKHAETAIDFLGHEDVRKFFDSLLNLLKHDVPLLVEPEVTYEQAIKYFVEHNPNTEIIAKGFLKMERDRGKLKLTWLFLDQNDKPVYQADGKTCPRQTYALKIDKELEECFDGKDIIVFE